MYEPDRVKRLERPHGLPFRIGKLGHVVLNVRDVERSARFYAEVLGFQIALVGSMTAEAPNVELNHIAFEVATLDEVIRARDHLRRHGVKIDFAGRRRAGCQLAVEFRDPDNHRLEIYWGIDQIGSNGHVRPSTEWKGAQSLEQAIADPVRGQDTTLHDPTLLDGEKTTSTR